jgi:hypothetical protein
MENSQKLWLNAAHDFGSRRTAERSWTSEIGGNADDAKRGGTRPEQSTGRRRGDKQ